MADLAITAANVVAGTDARIKRGTAGTTITAGKMVYLNSTTRKYHLADSNDATAEVRKSTGMALNGASLDQPLAVLEGGDVTMNAILTAGTEYFLSDTPGGICPLADVGSGEYVCAIGIAKTTTVLAVNLQFPNVAL